MIASYTLNISTDSHTALYSHIVTVILLISGDIQPNPGQHDSTFYPCGYCELRVNWSHQAVCCDGIIARVWFCCKCDSVDHTNSLFHSYELDLQNSFDIPSSLPIADRQGSLSNVTSLSSPTSFSPRIHSSPSLQAFDEAPSGIATPDT